MTTTDGVGEGVEARAGERGPNLGQVLGLLVLAWAAGIAALPLDDNSFFTHLATGRLILDEGSVPTADPYTFTAMGTSWTVQSWLASVAYAGAERLAGTAGLRILLLGTYLAAAGLLWRSSRAATTVLVRLGVVGVAMAVVTSVWNLRPFMAGVIGIGVVWLIVSERRPPWLLMPLFWVWGNTHGSFPLGIGLLVLLWVGTSLDERRVDPETRRYVGYGLLGTLLAALSPLGPRVLLFPFTALDRSDALRQIAEWQPPSFTNPGEQAFLVLLAVTILAAARRGRWVHLLPAVAFGFAGVVAQRNIVMAVMVLVPVLASSAGRLGTLESSDRPGLVRPLAVVGGAAVVLASVVAVLSPAQAIDGHPGHAVAWIDDGLPDGVRLAAQDRHGNLFEVLDGATGEVFVDDRVDMLPPEVFDDELSLARARPDWERVLDRYEIDAVLWERRQPLASLLVASEAWRVVYSDATVLVACRTAGDPCGR